MGPEGGFVSGSARDLGSRQQLGRQLEQRDSAGCPGLVEQGKGTNLKFVRRRGQVDGGITVAGFELPEPAEH